MRHLTLLFALVLGGCSLSGERFDSEQWKAGAAERNTVGTRWTMVKDLQRRHSLVGMSRPEVLDLLGDSDSTSKFADYDFVYWLGAERGFVSIDSEWLVLRLDSAGTVAEARVVTD